MTWQASGEGDVLSIVARPDGDATSVSVVIDRRGTLVLTGVVSSLAVVAACVAGIGLSDALPLLSPWVTVAGVGGTLAVARRFWTSSTQKARERIGIFMDAIGQARVQPDDVHRVGDDTRVQSATRP